MRVLCFEELFGLASDLLYSIGAAGLAEQRRLCSAIRRVEFVKGKAGTITDVFGTEDLYNRFGPIYKRVFDAEVSPNHLPLVEVGQLAKGVRDYYRYMANACMEDELEDDAELEALAKAADVEAPNVTMGEAPADLTEPPASNSLIRQPRLSPAVEPAPLVTAEEPVVEVPAPAAEGPQTLKKRSREEKTPEASGAPAEEASPVSKKAKRDSPPPAAAADGPDSDSDSLSSVSSIRTPRREIRTPRREKTPSSRASSIGSSPL